MNILPKLREFLKGSGDKKRTNPGRPKIFSPWNYFTCGSGGMRQMCSNIQEYFLNPWSLVTSAAIRSQFWCPIPRASWTWHKRSSILLAYGTLEFASSSTNRLAVLTSSPLAFAFSISLIISSFNAEFFSRTGLKVDMERMVLVSLLNGCFYSRSLC